MHADVIVANRAYRDHAVPPGQVEPPDTGRGGLLVATGPAVENGEGGTTWVGAGMGAHDREYVDAAGFEMLATGRGRLRHRRIFLDEATWNGFYAASANAFLWPLLHLVQAPLPSRTGYVPAPTVPAGASWEAYREANAAFANAALDAGRGESIWVHDYHLGLVPQLLRQRGYRGRIGFFLHTPFPDLAVAEEVAGEPALDHLQEWVRGILGAALVGLQSPADVDRFAAAAIAAGATRTDGGLEVDGREVRYGAYPVGIDVEDVAAIATTAGPNAMVAGLGGDAPVVVGLERQDYTKGIPERLQAMATLWSAGVRFHYLGLASPTREGVPGYDRFAAALGAALETAAAAAARVGCTCIQEPRAIAWEEVVTLLRDASVVCTSSLADGMNLVPLQAAIAQAARPAAERGVITTGRDAGVASAYAGFEDDGLVSLDPLNTAEFAQILAQALEGRPGRVSDRLVAAVKANDAQQWAAHFLDDLHGAQPC